MTIGAASPVSVVIPCYLCAQTVERAVESVLAQTFPPKEIWLVDDASPDHGATRQALAELTRRGTQRTTIRVIEQQVNRGPSAARNAGWNAATSTFVAFLDSDDSWHPRKLELQVAWMQAHPWVSASGHLQPQWHRTFRDAPSSVEIGVHDARRIRPRALLWSNRLTTSSVIVRRDVQQRFAEDLRRCEDHLLWSQIALDGGELFRLEVPLAWMHKAPIGHSGLSGSRWSMRVGELMMYARLYRERRVSALTLAGLLPLSLIKHGWSLMRTAALGG